MQLARKGYRVLVVDRARFPSDTISTHWIHQPGVAKLHNWGLLDAVHRCRRDALAGRTIAEFAPEVRERVAAAHRESRYVGTADLPKFYRRPYGPGWAFGR